MKGSKRQRTGPAPPVLAVVALLLAVGVVATAPLTFTFAKYYTEGTALASGRVAKWDIVLDSPVETDKGCEECECAYLKFNAPGTKTYTVTVTNNSEVMAAAPVLTLEEDDIAHKHGAFTYTITRTDGTSNLAPGGTATYELKIVNAGTTGVQDAYVALHIKAQTEQID